MQILVTGGAGFIGTNLIKRLIKEGHQVISIDNYSTGKKKNEQEGCEYYNLDIQSFLPTDYCLFSDVDVVYHLAAKARIKPSFDNPKDYFDTNIKGTYNIVECCRLNNCMLIYAGSSSKHSGRFKNPYTFSKDLGEDVVKLYQEHFRLRACIGRFYNVYGPHQLTEGGYTTLIGKWIHNIQNGNDCVIYGTGEKRRDFTHVDDIVDALIKMMVQFKTASVIGYEFELGRGKNYSVKEVADMFGIKPKYGSDRRGEAQVTLNTDTLAKDILNWKPQINLEDYIKKLKL